MGLDTSFVETRYSQWLINEKELFEMDMKWSELF